MKYYLPGLLTALSVISSNVFAIEWNSQSTVSPIDTIGTNDAQYDSLLLEANGDATVRQEADILQSNNFYSVWQDVTVRGIGSGADGSPDYVIDNRVLNPATGTLDTANLQVEFGVLRLEDVDFFMNSRPVFTDTLKGSAGITLDNATFTSLEKPLSYNIPTGTFTITALNGDNRFMPATSASGNIAVDTVITVNSGASLTYGVTTTTGRGSNTYTGAYSINLDNSAFTLDTFEVEAPLGQVNMVNGSTLTIGAEARLAVGDMTVSGTNTIELENSKAKFDIGTLQSGGGVTQLDFQVGSATLRTAATEVGVLKLANDFTINLTNKADLYVTSLEASGGTVNIDYGSKLSLGSSTTKDPSISGLIKSGATGTINSSGTINLFPGANIELGGSLTLNMTGAPGQTSNLNMQGGMLSGQGSVGDANSAIKFITKQGILSPGTAADPYGSISSDANVAFFDGNRLADEGYLNAVQGLLDGGIYQVDVGVDAGGNPLNDQLLYGAGDIEIQQLKELNVRVKGSPTARDLDGQLYMVIQAQNGGVAGTIQRYGQDINLVEDASVPVLIDFNVLDENDFDINGKAHITLEAVSLAPADLKRHPGVNPRRNRQQAAAVLPQTAPAPSNTAANTVYNALQSTTNAQAVGSFSSIHPETISSNMTVQLEQADNMLNTVLAVNTLSNNRDEEMQNLGSFFFGSSNTHASGVWANINYVDGKVDGQGDLGSFDYYLTSYTFGSSFISRADYDLGTFFGFSSEAMDEHDEANIDFSSEAYHIGLYGGLRFSEKLTMSWAFGHGWLNTESRRSVSLGTLQESAEADYDAQMNYLGVRANYDTSWLPAIDSNAFAGLGYLRIDQDAFSETNAPNLGLTIDRAIASSAIASLGVEMSRPLGQMESTRASTELRYDYDVMAEHNSEHDVRASFNFDPNNTQSFVGQNRGPHAVTFALGLDHEFDEDWLLSLAGTYTRSSHGREMGGDIVMNWLW